MTTDQSILVGFIIGLVLFVALNLLAPNWMESVDHAMDWLCDGLRGRARRSRR